MTTRKAVDQELAWVQAALSGDEAAFTALVEAYATPVYNLCYRMLGDPVEAEDAAQETFVRLYRRLHTYDQTRKFSSWVLAIASHHCIDRLRRRRLKKVSIEELPPWQPLISHRARPEDIVAERDRDTRLQALLMELPEDYRLPLVLHYWYGYSYDEICEITGLSLSALKSRLHRARHRLAKIMREKSPDLLPPHARTNGKSATPKPQTNEYRNETH